MNHWIYSAIWLIFIYCGMQTNIHILWYAIFHILWHANHCLYTLICHFSYTVESDQYIIYFDMWQIFIYCDMSMFIYCDMWPIFTYCDMSMFIYCDMSMFIYFGCSQYILLLSIIPSSFYHNQLLLSCFGCSQYILLLSIIPSSFYHNLTI